MIITMPFDEVWVTVSPEGFKLTEEQGIGQPFDFRVEVSAESRETWSVDKVWIVNRIEIGKNRFEERLTPIEGKFGDEVANFFYRSAKFGDAIQEKVNFYIVPDVSWTYHEAGRTM